MHKIVLLAVLCLFIVCIMLTNCGDTGVTPQDHSVLGNRRGYPKDYAMPIVSDNFMTEFFGNNIWVINLDRNPDRLHSVNNIFHRLGIKVRRLSAVDGKSDKMIPIIKQNVKNTITGPEIGCSLSHQKIWKYIVKHKIPWTTIFEDDICISDKVTQKTFGESMAEALTGHRNPQIVFFGSCNPTGDILKSQNMFNDIQIMHTYSVWCMHAYAITWRMAKYLLSHTKVYDKGIDSKINGIACAYDDKNSPKYE